MEEPVNDILQSLRQYADPNRVEFASRSYPTQMEVIGVTNPHIKEVRKELKKQTLSFSPFEKIALAKALVDTHIFECQQLAYEYLGKDKKALLALRKQDIQALGQNLDNWVSVDYYAGLIVGFAWREGILSTETIKAFLQSEDFWQRRIAIVATVSLNQKARGGSGDSVRTLEICELTVEDHTDMITKALSWALRELAKREAEPVVAFLDKHQNQLHKRVLREVGNKLNFGTKN